MADYETIESGTAATDNERSTPNFLNRSAEYLLKDVNTDIFDLSSSQPFKDRVTLIWEYCLPWSSFADIGNVNLPPFNWEEYKQRVQTNIGRYFYNYFVIGLIFMILYAIFNVWSIVVLALYGAMGYVLLIAYPEDIEINPSITINDLYKKIILGLGAVLAVMFGGVGCLIFSIVFFMLVIVGVHASISETES